MLINFRIILFLVLLFLITPLCNLYSQVTASDSTKDNSHFPFYVGGNIATTFKENTDNLLFLSGGLYFTQKKESSLLFEYGYTSSKASYFSAGVSIKAIRFDNNLILPEVTAFFVHNTEGHPEAGFGIWESLRFLHRFNSTLGLNGSVKFDVFNFGYFFFCAGLQFN